MRTALLVLASGLALSLSAPSYAEEFVPDAQHFSAPQPVATTQAAPGKSCHHLVHEGMLLQTEYCVSERTLERTRLQTQQNIMDFQRKSYVTPSHR